MAAEGRRAQADHGKSLFGQQEGSHGGLPPWQVLVVEDESNDACNSLMERGFSPVRYSHWGINTGQTNRVGADLRSHLFRAVWVGFPLQQNKERTYAHMTCIINWAQQCVYQGIPFVLFGSFGPPLCDAIIARCILKLRHHRIHHYGIKENPSLDYPSGTCFVTASTVAMPPHPCRCEGVPQTQHIAGWQHKPGEPYSKVAQRVKHDLLG